VRALGGVDRARKKAQDLAASAIAELGALPASPYRAALRDLALFSADRKV
jgi:geranylgeranyl pyrophosphate synthase